jgi:hypothetical protein
VVWFGVIVYLQVQPVESVVHWVPIGVLFPPEQETNANHTTRRDISPSRNQR